MVKSWKPGRVPTNRMDPPRKAISRATLQARRRYTNVCSKLMMLIPSRVPNMKGRVAGSHKLVECPKWRPAARSLAILILYGVMASGAAVRRMGVFFKLSTEGTIEDGQVSIYGDTNLLTSSLTETFHSNLRFGDGCFSRFGIQYRACYRDGSRAN